jgi:hypothetical protein
LAERWFNSPKKEGSEEEEEGSEEEEMTVAMAAMRVE